MAAEASSFAESERLSSQRSTKRRRKELRHRAQSLIEGASGTSDEGDEYETTIPEDEEEEFIDEETAELADEVMQYTSMERELLCETILGYLWWSLIFAIAPMIWFYPLNDLEISGYEAFIMTILSPVLTGLGAVMGFCQSLHGLAILRTLSLVGVASFQAPTTFIRLVMLSFGCGMAMLWFCGVVWNKYANERSLSFWGMILGFFLMLVSRAFYISINPVWADASSNKFCLVLGIVATLDRVYTGYAAAANPDETSVKPMDAKVQGPAWVLVSLGFGSLMFLTHAVFSEVSIVSRWGVGGYPDIGASPNPWGAGIPIALAIGSLLSPYPWTTSWYWWIVGSVGAAALYYAPGFASYTGGLILAVYVMSIWPSMVDRLFCRPAARTLTLANLFYIILSLGSVWVVAYNFVPGGVYTRERTDILLAITMMCIGLAMMTRSSPDVKELYGKAKKEDTPVNEEKPGLSQQGGQLLMFNNVAFAEVSGDKYRFFKTHVRPAMLFLVLVAVGMMFFRFHKLEYKTPLKEDPKVFSAMIWTVHFGYDNRGWPSFERAAQLINDTGTDVVGFLESDCSKSYLGSHDLPGWFEERLGMHTDFGPSTRDHTWGATLLSKYPIVKSQHHLLPSPEGELAPAISATVNISGVLVDFVLVHMGNDRDDLDRKLQAQELARIMDESPNPVVFLGYVTSSPDSRDYKVLLNKGRVKDIDSTDRDRWCEYIMYRGVTRLGYARISHGGLSDTEVQMARFRLPTSGENYRDNAHVTTSPRSVPEHLQFTDRFGSYFAGHHYGDHHYHMSTPKYFLPE